MSNINLLIIIDDKVYNFSVHYRTFEKLMENNFSCIKSFNCKYLDSGYAVVDLNKKIILDCQDAIDTNKLVGRRFEVLRV